MLAENKYGIGLLLMFVCTILGIAKAKSVYVINDTVESELQAYKIDGTNLIYQVGYTCRFDPAGLTGAVGLALDESEYGAFLFVTFEGENDIELVDAKTMEYLDIVEAPDPYGNLNLSGIVLDKSRRKLYVIDRQTNHLYVYSWNAEERNLTLDYGDPYYVELADCYQGYGLALDEENSRLYVGDNTTTVKYYDANDVNWGKIDEFTVTDKAIGIAIDVENQYVYTGSSQVGGSTYLTKYDLSTRTETRVDVGSYVLGISVDQDSSLVYITTYGGGSNPDQLMVYDSDLTPQSSSGDIGNPAGVVVGDVGYIHPFFVEKVDDVLGCASPRGEEITYTISIDYQWSEFGYTDPNIIDSIEVVDYLPPEADFDSAQPGGTYDPNYHSYTWILTDSSSFGDTLSFELVVQSQNERMTPGGMIENNVEVIATINEGDHVSRFTLQTPVCGCTGYTEVIYVDETVPDPCNGSSWVKAFDKLQDALAVALPCDQIWVAKGTYTPDIMSEPNMYFDMAQYVSLLGGFLGSENESYERNWLDNETILSGDRAGDEDLDYVLNINVEQALVDGLTIKDGSLAGVYCENGTVVLEHNKITSNEKGIYCNDTENSIIRNNLIYENQYGIYLKNTVETKIVNNTLVGNSSAGIYSETSIDPYISSCIIWDDAEINDIVDCNAIYSCLTDGSAGQGNIDGDPNYSPFAIGDNDYHLDPCSGSGSACIDAGDPCANYRGERDIDKHFRVLNGDGENYKRRVDIGADEYCNQGSNNDADFNNDGIVNYIDFAKFGAAWLDGPGDPNWEDGKYDLNDNQTIVDVNDLVVFAEEWLWTTCEEMEGIPMMEMMMGMGEGMGKMMGAESMLTSETTMPSLTTQQISEAQPQAEPTIEEQIKQIKYLLDWLYEVKDTIDEKTWLSLVTSLEELLKELAGD